MEGPPPSTEGRSVHSEALKAATATQQGAGGGGVAEEGGVHGERGSGEEGSEEEGKKDAERGIIPRYIRWL